MQFHFRDALGFCSLHASKLFRKDALANSNRLRSKPKREFVTKAVIRPNVAIVGGGHAGISVALRLASLPWTRLTRPQITLFDKSDRFTFLPMIYELALSQVEQWEISPKLVDLLSDTSVKFVHGNVENINTSHKTVEGIKLGNANNDAFQMQFDRAILAVGAQPAGISSVPGAKEYSIPFYKMEDALTLKKKLKSLKEQRNLNKVINFVVVGGGFSGVELGSCLAEEFGSLGSVMIIETSKRILNSGTDFNRKTSITALQSNGAVVQYNSRVTEVKENSISVEIMDEDGTRTREFPADVVLWTAGSTASDSLQNFGVPLGGKGRVTADKYLQVEGLEDSIYCLGDASLVQGVDDYSGTAQVAVQQAEYAAWNTWASLTGNPKLEYRYAHLGEMMVLGSKNAAVTTSVGLELDGSAAWVARRLAYLARMPTDRHRAAVAASWAINPLLNGMGDLVKESRRYRENV